MADAGDDPEEFEDFIRNDLAGVEGVLFPLECEGHIRSEVHYVFVLGQQSAISAVKPGSLT